MRSMRDRTIRRECELQREVGRALIELGRAQGRVGQIGRAIMVYEEVVERLGASDTVELLELVATGRSREIYEWRRVTSRERFRRTRK